MRAHSVRQIIGLIKTQTRRVMNPQPPPDTQAFTYCVASTDRQRHGRFIARSSRERLDSECDEPRWCPYDRERLWVAEAYRLPRDLDALTPKQAVAAEATAFYEADWGWPGAVHSGGGETLGRYRHARFMPRALSRLDLGVSRVCPQRVQDITVREIIAEGVVVPDVDYSVRDDPRNLEYERECFARKAFAEGWDAINAARGFPFASNPWVWVVLFELAAQQTVGTGGIREQVRVRC